jgi:hypothetical protein
MCKIPDRKKSSPPQSNIRLQKTNPASRFVANLTRDKYQVAALNRTFLENRDPWIHPRLGAAPRAGHRFPQSMHPSDTPRTRREPIPLRPCSRAESAKFVRQTRKNGLTGFASVAILRQPGSPCLRRILRIGFAPHESWKTSMVAHLRILFGDENSEPARVSDSRLRKFAKALFYSRASWRSRPSECSIAPFVTDHEPARESDARPLLRLFVGKASGPSINGWDHRTVPFFRLWNGEREEATTSGVSPETPAVASDEPPRRLRLVRHPAHRNVGRASKSKQKSKDPVTGR